MWYKLNSLDADGLAAGAASAHATSHSPPHDQYGNHVFNAGQGPSWGTTLPEYKNPSFDWHIDPNKGIMPNPGTSMWYKLNSLDADGLAAGAASAHATSHSPPHDQYG